MENLQEGLQVQLKSIPLRMFPKVAGKFQKKKIGAASENSKIFYKIFMPMPRLSDGSFFTLMKSCYSKRYIKIHGPPPSQMPYFFT